MRCIPCFLRTELSDVKQDEMCSLLLIELSDVRQDEMFLASDRVVRRKARRDVPCF
jgi:hypothetical protein